MAGRHAPDRGVRARLRPQVEHGLDARLAAVHARGPDVPRAPPRRASRSRSCTRSARTSCCRSATTRSCTARARCCTRCRATSGRSSRTCAPTCVHVGAPRQAAAVHGLGVRAAVASGAEQRGLDWWILDQPAHQGLSALVGAAQPRLPRARRRCGSRTTTPARLRVARRRRRGAATCVAFLRWSTDGDAARRASFNFGGNPVGPYRVGLPVRGRWDELAQHGCRGVRRLGRRQLRRGRRHRRAVGRHARPRSELTLPPLAALWLVRACLSGPPSSRDGLRRHRVARA